MLGPPRGLVALRPPQGSGWQGNSFLPFLSNLPASPSGQPVAAPITLGQRKTGAFKAALVGRRRFWAASLAHLPVQSGGGRPAKRGNSAHLNGGS